MKSLKRSLVFLVVFAMVLSTVAPVFAATPTDVVGTDSEDAVGKLVTLGVIAGYEDGTFKPEKNITRAEFAKIACYVVGLQSAAELSKGATKFSDVGADHWAAGFINVASEKGMIKGYPDNTFKPESNVNYAEAITILVRALGMGPVIEGKGTWPANYLSKASEAGVTDGVAGVVGDASALRGVIAQLSWNTLEAEKWGEKEYTTDGIVYGPLGKALIEAQYKDYVYKDADGKFVTKEFDDVDVVGTQLAGAVDKDEIKISSDKLPNLFGSTSGEDSGKVQTVEVTEAGLDLNSLFGKQVNILFGKDNKIAYIKVSNKDVIEGTVTDYNTDDDKIEVNDKEYAFKTGATIYVDSVLYTVAEFDDLAADLANSTVKATLVLDSGKVKAMNLFVADDVALKGLAAADMKQFVVKEIKTNGEVRDLNDAKAFDLDDVTADTDSAVFVKNGKSATKDDLKVGDAVTYVKHGDLYYVVITDNKVTGKVTKVASDADGNAGASEVRRKITIDSKEYSMAYDAAPMMTKTGDVDDAKVIDSTVSDFYNKDVTLTLNSLGEIVLVSGTVSGSATMQVGVVSKDMKEGNPDSTGNQDYYVQLVTPAGEKKSFTVTGDKYRIVDGGSTVLSNYSEANVDDTSLVVGDVVVYDVTADGKIDAENLYNISANKNSIVDSTKKVYVKYADLSGADTLDRIVDSSKRIQVTGVNYYANSSTTYMNMAVANVEKIGGWDKIVNDDYSGAGDDANTLIDDRNFYIVYDENNTVKSLLVDVRDNDNSADADTDPDYLSSDSDYGVFVELESRTDDDIITLNVNGKEVQYTVADGVYAQADNVNDDTYVEKGDLVEYTVNGDGKFVGGTSAAARWTNFRADKSQIADDENDSDKVKKFNKDDRIITFEAAKTRDGQANLISVKLASDAVIYDVRGDEVKVGTIDDLAVGQFIVVDDYSSSDDDFGIVTICE